MNLPGSMRAMTRAVLSVVAAIIAVSVLLACTPPSRMEGRMLFESNCSTCHGATGAGDGDMAVFVRSGVPNLRQLSKSNGGTFPEAHVVSVVTRVSAFHEDVVAMPDFGDLLQAKPATFVAPDGEVIRTNRAVLDIVAYIRSIQA